MPEEMRSCARFDIGALLRHLRAIAPEHVRRLNSTDGVLDGLGLSRGHDKDWRGKS